MTGDRRSVKLDQLYEFSSGLSKPRSEFGDGYPFLTFKDVFYNTFVPVLTERVRTSESERARLSIKRGDVFLTRTSETMDELGMSCVALTDIPDATFNGFTKRLRPRSQDIVPEYAGYFFRSTDFRNEIYAMSTLSTRASLNEEMLSRLSIKVPPIKEQLAIGRVLKSLDDKIELNRRMAETLEAMAQALFKSWFVDFNPVRAKAEGRPTGLPDELAALFPDRLIENAFDQSPEGWRLGQLEEALSEIEVGGRPKGGVGGYTSGVPSIGAESIVGLGRFDYSKTKYVPREFFENMTKGHVKDMDVLLYKDGGRPGEFEPHVSLFGKGFPYDTCAINEHVYRLRADSALNQSFLFFMLSSEALMEEMRRKGTGVAIPGLNSTQVKSLTTLFPTKEVLAAFDGLAGPLIVRVLSLCVAARTLAGLRDTLLPRLISGELRIRDAESAIEAA